MKPSFLARPVRLFGNMAVVILCGIFFLVPFALRGAKLALQRVENNVKDWLPSDFPETKDLDWFGDHFVGERFILFTWAGCTETDPRFQLLIKKLQSEVVSDRFEDFLEGNADDPDEQRKAVERLQARKMGDRLELVSGGDYHQNWGGRDEKWLQGAEGKWYFITPDGGFYRWTGESTLPGTIWRMGQRLVTGQLIAEGELENTLGEPTTAGRSNEFYNDPRKLTARLFKTVSTGPDTLEELAAEGGPLWPRRNEVADEDRPAVARAKALERLTGTLFAPAVPSGFTWEPQQFQRLLSADKLAELPDDWETQFQRFVARLLEREYGGDSDRLHQAPLTRQSTHWDQLFFELGVQPPHRQTCAIVTLSEIGKRDLARVIGRAVEPGPGQPRNQQLKGILGRPAGKLQSLAINECGIPAADLRMGGPPVDNVAIDEEGMITLFRLIGWSAAIGLTLSFLCFRSVKVTIMVFFVGGVSAMTSLALVWWSGRFPS